MAAFDNEGLLPEVREYWRLFIEHKNKHLLGIPHDYTDYDFDPKTKEPVPLKPIDEFLPWPWPVKPI